MKYIYLLLLVIATNSYAGLFDKKLQVYSCNSIESSLVCVGCEKEEFRDSRGIIFSKYESEFKVSKDNVIKIDYDNNVIYKSSTLSNCKIVDEKNWICEDTNNYKNLKNEFISISYTQKMIKGIYSSYSVSKTNGAIQKFENSTASCAK